MHLGLDRKEIFVLPITARKPL